MKKLLLTLFLFINILGYSQQAIVGTLDNGSRTVTFTNPAPIEVDGTPIITPATGLSLIHI